MNMKPLLLTSTFLATAILFLGSFTACAEPQGTFRVLVALEFKPSTTEHQFMESIGTFAELKNQIDSVKALEWGFAEPAQGGEKKYSHVFLLTFDDRAGYEAYRNNAARVELWKVLGKYVKKELEVVYEVME